MSNEKILKLVDVQKMSIQELFEKYNQGYVMEGCTKCGQQRDIGNLGYHGRTMGRTVVSGFQMLNPALCMTSVNQGETVTITVEQTNPGTAPYVYKIYVDGVLVHTSASVIQTTYTLSYTVTEAGGVSPGVAHQYGSTVADSCPTGAQTTVLDVCAINVISISPACPVPTARMIIAPLVVTKYGCVGGVCGVDPNGPYDTLEACQAVCAPVTANLVDNPGFETVDPAVSTKPQYWVKSGNYAGAVFTYPDTGRTGTDKSVSVSSATREAGKAAVWVQDIVATIDPTRPYKLSGYMKTENIVGGGAGIMVDWYNSAGTRTGYSFAGGVRKTGTIGWALYESTFTPPVGTTKAKVRGDIYDTSGKALFDDMSLVKT